MLLIPLIHLLRPPKVWISIVFNYSWDDCYTQEKLKTKVIHIFRGCDGGRGVEQTRCIMGDVQMVNFREMKDQLGVLYHLISNLSLKIIPL